MQTNPASRRKREKSDSWHFARERPAKSRLGAAPLQQCVMPRRVPIKRLSLALGSKKNIYVCPTAALTYSNFYALKLCRRVMALVAYVCSCTLLYIFNGLVKIGQHQHTQRRALTRLPLFREFMARLALLRKSRPICVWIRRRAAR